MSTLARTSNAQSFHKNQRQMYDCTAWSCNCSLGCVVRRTTERSFSNDLCNVAALGPPSCGFRNQAYDQQSLDRERIRRDLCKHRPCYWRRNLPGFRSRRCRRREGGQSGPGSRSNKDRGARHGHQSEDVCSTASPSLLKTIPMSLPILNPWTTVCQSRSRERSTLLPP
jgi:hypothetical protein